MFDKSTRNQLARLVGAIRERLKDDITAQLQTNFRLQPDGTALSLDGLTDDQRTAAEELRQLLDHFAALIPATDKKINVRAQAHDRLVREIGFTILNRLAALRLCEERGLVVECVRQGLASAGFQMFDRLANGALGPRYETYRAFLENLFDELAIDLGVLFDRHSPLSHVFPGERALEEVLGLLNDPALAHLWAADETIGWIYQYYNDEAERKQMRDASQAPRNSRELAVRNQFFTPRYVVEFLTDNTLGRIWYEMRGGDTALREKCRYLVIRPEAVDETAGQRAGETEGLSSPSLAISPSLCPKKDPRDIKMLDPAGGSGHFGLYCFDLFETIYAEAYDDPDLGPKLQADYPERAAFLRDVPRLILEHNLHIIDIDPRACQIAALALWLRAQRSWKEMGLKAHERPRVTKANVVCAEPMPGERDLLDEFAADLQPPELAELVRFVFDRMQLAGEAGSLLKIEEDLRAEIEELRAKTGPLFALGDFWDGAEARVLSALRDYTEQAINGGSAQRLLFADDAAQGFAFIDLCLKKYDVVLMNPPFGDGSLPSKSYIDETYGDTKGDVYKAFVEGFQDRLLPVGFLGIISSRTGFFLGQSQDWRERVVLRLYRPLLLADLGFGVLDAMVETAAYVLRTISEKEDRNQTLSILPDLFNVQADKNGYFSIPKYQAQRNDLKRHQAIREISRLLSEGYISRVEGHYPRFILNVDFIQNAPSPIHFPYPVMECFRLTNQVDKAGALQDALENPSDSRRFMVSPERFADVPGQPFAYWVREEIRRLFVTTPPFESNGRTVKQGLATADDFRFIRLWPEVSPKEVYSHEPALLGNGYWKPFAKGGRYSPYFADIYLVVNWNNLGAEVRHFDRAFIRNETYYSRPGITWPLRTNGLSFRLLPQGCVFGHKGPAAFVPQDDPIQLHALVGLMNSTISKLLVSLQLARTELAQSYEVGLIQKTPVPILSDTVASQLSAVVLKAHNIVREQDTTVELSHIFCLPALAMTNGSSIQSIFDEWNRHLIGQGQQLNALQLKIDSVAFKLYDIEGGDQQQIEDISVDEPSIGDDDNAASLNEDELGGESSCDLSCSVADLVFYSLGCLIGRWDIRIALDPSLAPKLPDPIEPLPVCPPGMLVGPDGLPATPGHIVSEAWLRARPNAITLPPSPSSPLPGGERGDVIPDAEYPVRIAWDGILVDDAGLDEKVERLHEDDIVRRVRDVLGVLWGDRADAIEQEACEILGVKSLRDYFRAPSGFFADHLKRYSKSRRQAPIYWPLSTASGRYTVWVYYHRLTSDTLFTIVNHYVTPKIDDVQTQVDRLSDKAKAASGKAAVDLRAQLDDLKGFLSELNDFKAELLRVAALPYKPDLNDGVIINAAPLHKLFRLRKWATDTAAVWKKLEAGEYEWAHLAYTVWPKRVEKVCETDRSIAIAHNLEHLCKVEVKKSKGKRKKQAAEEEETEDVE